MPFTFLKYLQPTRYFTLFRKDGSTVYPIPSNLPEEVLQQLAEDTSYLSNTSRQYDLSWQAIVKGYVGDTATYATFEKIPIADEYRFIQKNFHPIWAFYVLLLRLFSLKNPFIEIPAFLKTKNTARASYGKLPIKDPLWHTFESHLVESKPFISVIIPTLNRYAYLKEVLLDFEKQTYSNFEIIVVDQSQPFQKTLYDGYALNIKLIRQEEPALWLARNTAIKNANGTLIALSEDDVRVPKDWIENHIRCLDYFKCAISAGVFFPEGETIPQNRSYFSMASQFATGNAMLYRSVFANVGLFDRQFEGQRMGDGEFGLRCYLEGFKSVSNPFAYCLDVKAPVGGLRQMGSWDAFRTKKWFAPRPIPSVLYLFRKYYGRKRALLALLKTVPPSIVPYQFKRNKPLLLLGSLFSLLLLPLVLFQVWKSWSLASKKLKEGARIDGL